MANVHSREFGAVEGQVATGAIAGPQPIIDDLDYALNSLNPATTLKDGSTGGLEAKNCQPSFLQTIVGTVVGSMLQLVAGLGISVTVNTVAKTITIANTITINGVSFNSSGNLILAAGTGIAVSQNPGTNTVTVTAQGNQVPSAHASTHLQGGADPITGGALAVNTNGTHTGPVVGNADTSTNVTTNINSHAINTILESDGVTAKNATKVGGLLPNDTASNIPVYDTTKTISGNVSGNCGGIASMINGVRMNAKLNSDFSGGGIIPFTSSLDPFSVFNNSTYKCTPPAGTYLILWNIYIKTLSSPVGINFKIIRNISGISSNIAENDFLSTQIQGSITALAVMDGSSDICFNASFSSGGYTLEGQLTGSPTPAPKNNIQIIRIA